MALSNAPVQFLQFHKNLEMWPIGCWCNYLSQTFWWPRDETIEVLVDKLQKDSENGKFTITFDVMQFDVIFQPQHGQKHPARTKHFFAARYIWHKSEMDQDDDPTKGRRLVQSQSGNLSNLYNLLMFRHTMWCVGDSNLVTKPEFWDGTLGMLEN